MLQTTNLTAADTEFNNHNSYAAVDFNVTYLVCSVRQLTCMRLPYVKVSFGHTLRPHVLVALLQHEVLRRSSR